MIVCCKRNFNICINSSTNKFIGRKNFCHCCEMIASYSICWSFCLTKSICEDINQVANSAINISTITSCIIKESYSICQSATTSIKCVCRISSAICWRSTYIHSNCSCCGSSNWKNRIICCRIRIWISKYSLITITSTSECNRITCNRNTASGSKRVSTDSYDQITCCMVVSGSSWSKLSQRRCARICNCSISLLS